MSRTSANLKRIVSEEAKWHLQNPSSVFSVTKGLFSGRKFLMTLENRPKAQFSFKKLENAGSE